MSLMNRGTTIAFQANHRGFKRFHEGLNKTLRGTTKKCENEWCIIEFEPAINEGIT